MYALMYINSCVKTDMRNNNVQTQVFVYGGVVLIAPDGKVHSKLVTTAVVFKRLEAFEIDNYVKSGEWVCKAGGYDVQGKAGAFTKKIIGSYSNIVGLPLFETSKLLKGALYV